MKIFKVTLILLLLLSCKEQSENITIKLESKNGYGVFKPGRRIIFPSKDVIEYKGVPKDIKEYVVRSIPIQRGQYVWNKYKSGGVDKNYFLKAVSYYKLDSTKMTTDFVDTEVLLLIGTNEKNKRVIIIDSNNDEDFNGEEILLYEYPISKEEQKKVSNSLPSIETSFEFFLNNEIITKRISLKPSPYKKSLRVKFRTDNEIEKKYFLFISIPEYRKGKFRINKEEYNLFVSNRFTKPSFSNQDTKIFINKLNQSSSELDGDIPYQIGDIFNSNGHDYQIESISIFGDTLKLKYIGDNAYPVGITEGFYLPKFKDKKLDNSIFTLEDYPNKYVLIDFWGTWCNPCIKLIPKLKELNNEFKDKDFVLVSIAYDKNIEKVQEFINKEEMNWVHVFADRNQFDKNSLVNKLRISKYPTTILISPSGKIISRGNDLDKLKKIIDQKVNLQ